MPEAGPYPRGLCGTCDAVMLCVMRTFESSQVLKQLAETMTNRVEEVGDGTETDGRTKLWVFAVLLNDVVVVLRNYRYTSTRY